MYVLVLYFIFPNVSSTAVKNMLEEIPSANIFHSNNIEIIMAKEPITIIICDFLLYILVSKISNSLLGFPMGAHKSITAMDTSHIII